MAKKETKPKPDKNSTTKTTGKPSNAKKGASLPYLLDFTYSLSNLLIFLLGITTTSLSLYYGASILSAVLRGSLAIIGIGAVCWLFNYYLSNQVIATAAKDFQTASEKEAERNSTMEIKA